MFRILFSLLLAGVLVFCFSQNLPRDHSSLLRSYHAAERLFQSAEKLSDQAEDNDKLLARADEVYTESLQAFTAVASMAGKSGYDSLAYFAYLRKGLIESYLNQPGPSKNDYLAAISLKQQLPSIPDSTLFIGCIYTGAIYYDQVQYDSAIFYYKKAEAIKDQYNKPLQESQRLYNRLGVIYYETGNYRQARNYFDKAIAVLKQSGEKDKSLLGNYLVNIGSLLIKLEEFEEAKTVFTSALPYEFFTNEVYHNLAIVSLHEHQYSRALEQLQKVNYGDNKKNIELFYIYGMTYAGLNEMDSSGLYLHRALAENLKWNGHRKNVSHGMILKFQGDVAAKEQNWLLAASFYQQAIAQYYAGFADTSVRQNPDRFTGVFSYINLFNTLVAKADVFERQYRDNKDLSSLESALEAYKAAFRLTEYVEETYDSDEAREFLGKIKYTVHSKPIDLSLVLYGLTRKKNHLEDAWQFDQRNKASVLSYNVKENEWKSQLGDKNDLLREEAATKSLITRLSLKASRLTDSAMLAETNAAIRDNEMELGKIRDQINEDPLLRDKKISTSVPSVFDIQKKLDNTTALVSYHLSENELLSFFMTGNQFDYHITSINKEFFDNIESFKSSLHNVSSDHRYNGTAFAKYLFQQLIGPFQQKLQQVKRLVVIPDDELNYLPFEALQDENNNFLVQRVALSYQYTASLLAKNHKPVAFQKTLAFAPYSSADLTDKAGQSIKMLPASGEEIKGLEGRVLLDTAATKTEFLRSANHYGIIHLATHAAVNNDNPSLSYISFYPDKEDHKLYASEIYNMRLDTAGLVILSACETGTGQLVRGEGLMSLSRAFAYAGCPDIITSLWKAEDKTTAYLTIRLHYYLDKKYSPDMALQYAKLDLLKNNDIEARYKSPAFWAHIIFIGSYDAQSKKNNWYWVAIGIVGVLIGYYIISKRTA